MADWKCVRCWQRIESDCAACGLGVCCCGCEPAEAGMDLFGMGAEPAGAEEKASAVIPHRHYTEIPNDGWDMGEPAGAEEKAPAAIPLWLAGRTLAQAGVDLSAPGEAGEALRNLKGYLEKATGSREVPQGETMGFFNPPEVRCGNPGCALCNPRRPLDPTAALRERAFQALNRGTVIEVSEEFGWRSDVVIRVRVS